MTPINRAGSTGQSVLLGMSGGVDSSVASLMLKRQGWQVTGLYLVTHDGGWDAAADARALCGQLGLDLAVLDVRESFRRLVVDDFIAAYLRGRTPNPCIRCNPAVKFAALLREADRLGCRAVASGHYAGIRRHPVSRRLALVRTPAGIKDQTYFLCRLSQDQLERIVFPLDGLNKDDVRQIAGEAGLTGAGGRFLAEKPDSQDICFIPDGDYAGMIRRHLLENGPADALRLTEPGPVVDIAGTVIGSHRGLIHYTVGQRKGFQVRTTERLFVIGGDAAANALIVGAYDHVLRRQIRITDPVYSGAASLADGERLLARVRSSAREVPCEVRNLAGGALLAIFDQPVAAPAPGQTCVLYQDNLIVAGGTIAGDDEDVF